MSDKIYVGTGKAIQTQYGELLKISLTEDDVETLKENFSNGWVNLNVNKRREPSKKGATHYLVIDDWKPEKQDKAPEKKEITADDVWTIPF